MILENRLQTMQSVKGVLVASIGAPDEAHGPALPSFFDDVYARYVVSQACNRTGAHYLGHIPVTGDSFELVKEWSREWAPNQVVIEKVSDYLKRAVKLRRRELHANGELSKIIIFAGHGGLNFIKNYELILFNELNIPVTYIAPLEGLQFSDPKRGIIRPGHATDCEHSLALYLGHLNIRALDALNQDAAKDPFSILARFPVLNSLCGFMLKEYFPQEKYRVLRSMRSGCIEKTDEFIRRATDGKGAIYASYRAGQYFTQKDIQRVMGAILN